MEIIALLILVGTYSLLHKKKNGKSLFISDGSSELFWSKTLGYFLVVFSIWVIQGTIRSGDLCRKQSLTISEPSVSFFLMIATLSILPGYLMYRAYHLSVDDLGPGPGEVRGATVGVQLLVAVSVCLVLYRLYDSFCVYSFADIATMVKEIRHSVQ